MELKEWPATKRKELDFKDYKDYESTGRPYSAYKNDEKKYIQKVKLMVKLNNNDNNNYDKEETHVCFAI